MSTVAFNYGTWWQWDPNQFPNQKVAFSAFEKIIYVNEGVTELDVKIDIYSAWKEWALNSPEYPLPSWQGDAISAIGGEPLTDALSVGSTFFLENGWRIQPFASKKPYVLTVNGNIYTREAGDNPFLFAEGVSVNLTRSNLVDQLVANASVTDADYTAIANRVWQVLNTATNKRYGTLVQELDSDMATVVVNAEKALKKGEFLALK